MWKKLALHDFPWTLLVERQPCFNLFLVENIMHCRHLSVRALIAEYITKVQKTADNADTTRWQHQIMLLGKNIHTVSVYDISLFILLFHRKSTGFQRSRRIFQHISHMNMNMRGGAVTVNHWISWLLATLVITWTFCRTSGPNSTH